MAAPERADPVKLLAAVLWREREPLEEALRKMEERWGEIDYQGLDHPLSSTDYYRSEMGEPLQRRIVSFALLIPPESIREAKLAANSIEDSLRRPAGRQVNLDVGYLDLHKVVLASAKYGPMKVHLGSGIYADLVCRYSQGVFQHLEWTFQDFRARTYDAELIQIRSRYRAQLRATGPSSVR